MRYVSEHFDLPLGTCVMCPEDDYRWVFIGYADTCSGSLKGDTAVFCREVTDRPAGTAPWLYTASNPKTLIKKFPELEMYVKENV